MNSVESRPSRSRLATGRIGRGSLRAPLRPAPPSSQSRLGRERGTYASRTYAGNVIRGAAEVMLLSRDPHLAARAAWVLLKER
jgi:hypothetical protein